MSASVSYASLNENSRVLSHPLDFILGPNSSNFHTQAEQGITGVSHPPSAQKTMGGGLGSVQQALQNKQGNGVYFF